jgi:hypothetical protein
MPSVKLTKREIEKIEAPDPSGKQVIHWDAELRGFGVLASGTTTAKTYVVQRRLPDGKTRRVTIGAVGEFEKVEDARRNASTCTSLPEKICGRDRLKNIAVPSRDTSATGSTDRCGI